MIAHQLSVNHHVEATSWALSCRVPCPAKPFTAGRYGGQAGSRWKGAGLHPRPRLPLALLRTSSACRVLAHPATFSWAVAPALSVSKDRQKQGALPPPGTQLEGRARVWWGHHSGSATSREELHQNKTPRRGGGPPATVCCACQPPSEMSSAVESAALFQRSPTKQDTIYFNPRPGWILGQ